MINGIILASGYSRRMGKDKLTQKVGAQYLIEYILQTALASELDTVAVVYRSEQVKSIASDYAVNLIYNSEAHKGQSESIRKAVQALDNGGAYMFFVGDQPLISVETVNQLIQLFQSQDADIFVPKYNGKRGSPVLFSNGLRQALLSLEGDEGGRQLIRSGQWKVVEVDIDAVHEGIDVDIEADLRKMETLVKDALPSD